MRTTKTTARVWVCASAVLTVLLTGCGSRGDLYLPDRVHPENTPEKAPQHNPDDAKFNVLFNK